MIQAGCEVRNAGVYNSGNGKWEGAVLRAHYPPEFNGNGQNATSNPITDGDILVDVYFQVWEVTNTAHVENNDFSCDLNYLEEHGSYPRDQIFPPVLQGRTGSITTPQDGDRLAPWYSDLIVNTQVYRKAVMYSQIIERGGAAQPFLRPINEYGTHVAGTPGVNSYIEYDATDHVVYHRAEFMEVSAHMGIALAFELPETFELFQGANVFECIARVSNSSGTAGVSVESVRDTAGALHSISGVSTASGTRASLAIPAASWPAGTYDPGGLVTVMLRLEGATPDVAYVDTAELKLILEDLSA